MTHFNALQESIYPTISRLDARTSAPSRLAVMVVDGQALFRSGLVRILQDDERFEVVAASPSGSGVAEVCASSAVDVLVTDLDLGSRDGIELTRCVGTTSPDTRVLILTSVADSRVILALAAGAAGFLLKDSEPDSIRSALVSIHFGASVLCREAVQCLMGVVNGDRSHRDLRLTRRETDVVRLLAAGNPNKYIAERLDISDKTVRNYVSRVYRKLAMQNRDQIAMYALHSGITQAGEDAP